MRNSPTTAGHESPKSTRIAYFISPHGYGHAARSAAGMEAIHSLDSSVRFEIFTQVPHWFFAESLSQPFGYHNLLTDIGLAQKTSLSEDVPETIKRLDSFIPFDPPQLAMLAGQLEQLECQLILSDISPLGIAVAQEMGLPAVLIENFTWDWIYQGYPEYSSQLKRHITYMQRLFEAADYHIQTEPVCDPRSADLTTTPVSRKVRSSPAQVRQKLEIPDGAKLVMMTMGGMNWDYTFLERLKDQGEIVLVAAGNTEQTERRGNLILLARNSGVFHPDLVNACDAVIGKTGYSTLAEVYQAGVPFGYISRPTFREAPVMVDFVQDSMQGLPFSEVELESGDWFSKLPDLLALPRIQRDDGNGADQIAHFILSLT